MENENVKHSLYLSLISPSYKKKEQALRAQERVSTTGNRPSDASRLRSRRAHAYPASAVCGSRSEESDPISEDAARKRSRQGPSTETMRSSVNGYLGAKKKIPVQVEVANYF